jgi:hypothetical protein
LSDPNEAYNTKCSIQKPQKVHLTQKLAEIGELPSVIEDSQKKIGGKTAKLVPIESSLSDGSIKMMVS